MNFFKSTLVCAFSATMLSIGMLHGAGLDNPDRTQENIEDDDFLADFIRSKRKNPLKQKLNNLRISADINTRWEYQVESINGRHIDVFTYQEPDAEGDEGTVFVPGDRKTLGRHAPRVRLDLYFDWDYKRMWARSHVRFGDNTMGVEDNGRDEEIDPAGYHGSGIDGKIKLREAYIGYDLYKKCDDRFLVELGRRGQLNKVFDSELQFGSRFDGIFFKYSSLNKRLGGWYAQWAGFVVDSIANHFSWAAEVGLDHILDSGFGVHYSYIDWHLNHRNRYFVRNPNGFRFKVSQWLLYWEGEPFKKGQQLQAEVAFLMNHIPSGFTQVSTNSFDSGRYQPAVIKNIGRNHNKGGYVAVQYNDIFREGDWKIKGIAAYLEAQCIPDGDVRSIGTGNGLNETFTAYGRGNTNWKGYMIQGAYAVTDNFVVQAEFNSSWSIDSSIAGSHHFSRTTLEANYSF